MFKKLLVTLIIACLIVCTAYAASAAAPLSFVAGFDPETGVITLDGEGHGNITVRIGYVPSDGSDPSESFTVSNPPVVFDVIDADGGFIYKCILPDGAPAGGYIVYLRDDVTVKSDGFRFYDVAAAERDIIPVLNQAISDKNFTAFSSCIKDNAEKLGIDSSDEVYKGKFSSITQLLYKCNESFSSAPDFYNEYYNMYSIAAISGSGQATIEAVMKKYASNLGINYDADYASDTKLSTNAKTKLCTLLSGYDYISALPSGATFSNILKSLKPVAAVATASKWQDINKVMTVDFKSDFEFIYNQNSAYSSLSSLTEVYSKMMSDVNTFTTLKSVQSSFDSAVSEVLASRHSPSNSGGGGGGLSVTMPSNDSEIVQTAPVTPALMFFDVASDFWGFEAINELAKSKTINGYEDGSFNPSGLITRAEFIKIVVSLAKTELSESSFSDVPADAWYNSYVGAAQKAGIAQGADGKFNPESSITRQDAAVILYRILTDDNTAFEEETKFADDADVAEYAKAAVSALGSIKVINGYENGQFLPLGNITRAEAAQMLYKAKKYIS